ncbi:MAG: DNA translocase FtsK [Tissierellia bacterium]|nr:DNA translocase FtsK [Tissierellia bacterium]
MKLFDIKVNSVLEFCKKALTGISGKIKSISTRRKNSKVKNRSYEQPIVINKGIEKDSDSIIFKSNHLDSEEFIDEFKGNIVNADNINEYDNESIISHVDLRNDSGKLDPEKIEIEINADEIKEEKPYEYPPMTLLNRGNDNYNKDIENKLINQGKKIEDTLENFNIEVKVKSISRGPNITRYEIEPSPDVKLSKISNLSDNLALSLAASNIRIEAPIPGKSLVGIEVPNNSKSSVALRDMLETSIYQKMESELPLVLGQDVSGNPIIETIDKMPHMLICGATGSGKSVCINSIILGILYKSDPKNVKMILIDPKVVELNVYNRIPHLLIPVITDPRKASMALNWAVNEMESRYKTFAKNGVRDINGYNSKQIEDPKLIKLPKIVIVIDELADLMMVSAKEIEEHISRLAQMARAAGIHLVVATQRPSVDVITGTIKANIPSRIAFAVSSQTDSRTILDMGGAEKLLGKGDMLFYPSYYAKPKRVQGCFVGNDEIEKVVGFIASNNEERFNNSVVETIEMKSKAINDQSDPLLERAIELVTEEQQASVSYLQRKLKLGYSRAARLIDEMEDMGIVAERDGTKPRNVLVTKEQWENREI